MAVGLVLLKNLIFLGHFPYKLNLFNLIHELENIDIELHCLEFNFINKVTILKVLTNTLCIGLCPSIFLALLVNS